MRLMIASAMRIVPFGVMVLAGLCAVAAAPEMWVTPPPDAVAVEVAPPLDKSGNFVVSPRTTWAEVPAYQTREGVPQGRLVNFQVSSTASDMYPGIAGPYERNVWVYVPAGYVEGTVLPLMVDHDGRADAVVQTTLIAVMDNLIAEKRLPMMAGLFIANGGDGRPSQRSLEYDTVSGKYAEYIEKVIIPLAEQKANVKFTRDGNARGVIGQSSGSAAAFGMAWFHNELYTRVISYSGTFVNIQSSEQHPHGAWEYHENLIPKSTRKNIRIWMHVSDRDNSYSLPEDRYRNWPLANNRMAAALAAKGYEYQYLWSTDSGHVERGVERQTLEQAMEWVWRTYRAR
jgi:enterochelin esterase family protein